MNTRPSDAAYRSVGHVLARLYRAELERRDAESEQPKERAA